MLSKWRSSANEFQSEWTKTGGYAIELSMTIKYKYRKIKKINKMVNDKIVYIYDFDTADNNLPFLE